MSVQCRWWLVLAASSLLQATASGQNTAPVGAARVAVLVSDELSAARSVQELALAQLSGDKGLDLLDRSAVDKLLQEQKLSLTGLVDADKAIQAGKILAVDVLGVIDVSAATKQNIALVVYDAATGVRLVDQGFSTSELEPQGLETAAGLRRAVQAWRAGTKHLKTVCFLPARNADLPTYLDPFCEAMSAMLERQLLHHPGVAALERKRLEGFTREKELATAAAARELLASVLLLELEFAQGNEKKSIRATIVVRDHAGKLLHQLSHEVAEAEQAMLLEPLTRKLHKALNTADGSGVVKRSREANRFLREAQALWQHRLFRQGTQAAEAAYALQADDEARLLLAEYLLGYSHQQMKPTRFVAVNQEFKTFQATGQQVRAALSLARRADQLIESAKPRVKHLPDNSGNWSLAENGECCYNHARFVQDLGYLDIQPAEPQVAQEVRDFRMLAVQRNLERIRELAERVGPNGVERFTAALFDPYMPRLVQNATDSATAVKALRDAFTVWLDISAQLSADDFPPECGTLLAQRVLPYFHDARLKEHT